eukprot:jgi/Tetstr1/461453/TSEL_006562.t1
MLDVTKAVTFHFLVADTHLLCLQDLYDKNLTKALSILDQRGVSVSVGRGSRRRVVQVCGKGAGEHYLVFPSHYCTCHAFFYDVVSKGEAIECKHMLAARVAIAAGLAPEAEIDDADVARLLIAHSRRPAGPAAPYKLP